MPHANPTVEPELRALMPAAVSTYATRLTHPSPQVEERLHHYIRHLPEAIATFGSMRLAFPVNRRDAWINAMRS